MPVLLNDALFPISYQPWYVFEATLKAAETTFDKYDVLVSDSGTYTRAANDAVVVTGYVVALEKWYDGMTTLQVATPGSLIPGVLAGAVQPNGLVKIALGNAATGMRYTAAAAADIATGKVVGRYRSNKTNHKLLTVGAANDIVEIQTGVF